MYRLWKMSLGILTLLSLLSLSSAQSTEYTFDEVITAYDAGQFRVIHTRSNRIRMSPNGDYVIAAGDGLYRVSDWTFWENIPLDHEYHNLQFSPDGKFVANDFDGVYRLSDLEEIIPIVPVEVDFRDPIAAPGYAGFSPNSEYVSVSGFGVYRLSDGQQVITTADIYARISFSPDSTFAAVADEGVYRLVDGQRLFDISGFFLRFSPDSAYVFGEPGGFYRLSDGYKLFDADTPVHFSPNIKYAQANHSVYRLSDGQKLFDVNQDFFYRVRFSPNSDYVFVGHDGIYRISDGERLFDAEDAIFSPDGTLVAIENDGVYRLDNKQRLFGINGIFYGDGEFALGFSADGAYLAVLGDGVYHVDTAEKLIDLNLIYSVAFSPEMTYVVAGKYRDSSTVYRLSDGQKLFSFAEWTYAFSPNGDFLLTPSNVYRIDDGHRFEALRILDVSAGIMTVGNSLLIVDPTQENQRINVALIREDKRLFAEPKGGPGYISRIKGYDFGIYLTILNEQSGWYQVSNAGKTGWISVGNVEHLILPE